MAQVIQALTIVHMIVSVILIAVVLVQFGRGAEAGFFSDTSSQGVFSGPGPANMLTRLTTVLAILFLGLALFLANIRGRYRDASVFDQDIPSTTLETTQDASALPPGGGKPSGADSQQAAPVPQLPQKKPGKKPSL